MIISVATSKGRPGGLLLIPLFSGPVGKSGTRADIPLNALEVPETLGERTRLIIPGRDDGRIVVVSMGKRKDCTVETIRRVGGAMAGAIVADKCNRAIIDMTQVLQSGVDHGVQGLCEGLELGAFRFDRHKSDGQVIPDCRVALAFGRALTSARAQIQRGCTMASAVNFARGLAHEPANVINPVTLAARARVMAKAAGLKCTIIDEKQMKRAKMGAMLAVGVGSVTPPRLIVLQYAGRGRGKPVVLIGKAITFDTGGYSIKDRHGIVGMKYDKCGGTAVLGIMRAVAELKPKVPVIGIIAAAENMISGKSYRPNDIITSMSGRTIEIISTDAEGRLVLADALTYAQKHYQPRAMIDLATLTGGVVVALGKVLAGLFTNDDRLKDRLIAAGKRTFERLWPLPMDDDYFNLIKGEDSDVKNSAGREAHAVVGAIFLKQFVDAKIPWAHIDIAGVAAIDKKGPYCPPGATGFGVRLLCDYLAGL